jgi:hypothetical protein
MKGANSTPKMYRRQPSGKFQSVQQVEGKYSETEQKGEELCFEVGTDVGELVMVKCKAVSAEGDSATNN